MSRPVRLATFNVENLFDRARVLNFADNTAGDQRLLQIHELQTALAQYAYDQPKILKLCRALKDCVTVIENREKLFWRRGFGIVGIKANGRVDWGRGSNSSATVSPAPPLRTPLRCCAP